MMDFEGIFLLSNWIKLLIIYLIWRTLQKFFLKPYFLLQFYKKQGINYRFMPFLGHTFVDIGKGQAEHNDALYFIKKASLDNPTIKAFASNIVGDVVVNIVDEKIIKEFFAKQENFVKYDRWAAIYVEILGKGLVFAEGASWKHKRRILSELFHFEFFQGSIPMIKEVATRRLQLLKKQENLDNIVLISEIQEISGEIVGKLFFGEDLTHLQFEGKSIPRALLDILSYAPEIQVSIPHLLLGLGFYKLGILKRHRMIKAKLARFKKFMLAYIQERRSKFNPHGENKRKDILELLFKANHNNPENKLTDTDLMSEFATFFFAGTDTTSHTTDMGLYAIGTNPELKERVYSDILQNYPNCNEMKSDDLHKMETVTALIKETLRIYSPVNALFARKALQDVQLDWLKIKAGTIIECNFSNQTYNTKNHTDPTAFNIDRWSEIPSPTKNMDSFANTPFSAGARNCIGQHFAQISMRIIISELLLLYDVKVVDGYKLVMGFKSVYEPINPIPFKITPRV
jgi:cytochrome P450